MGHFRAMGLHCKPISMFPKTKTRTHYQTNSTKLWGTFTLNLQNQDCLAMSWLYTCQKPWVPVGSVEARRKTKVGAGQAHTWPASAFVHMSPELRNYFSQVVKPKPKGLLDRCWLSWKNTLGCSGTQAGTCVWSQFLKLFHNSKNSMWFFFGKKSNISHFVFLFCQT